MPTDSELVGVDRKCSALRQSDAKPTFARSRTNKTAALDPAPTDPSWHIPAVDRVTVKESLFAAAGRADGSGAICAHIDGWSAPWRDQIQKLSNTVGGRYHGSK